MLELLVAGGGKPFYPNSGPGPKSLVAGNEQAGYFGTLTQTQLLTATEIFNLLGLPAVGPTTDPSLIWCKFFYKGKIVYIPTRPINDGSLQQFSWEDLYQLGLVYGVDGDGNFPSPSSSPVNQRTTFNKTFDGKVAGFWPRMPAANDVDPTTTSDAGASGKGELAELLSNVYQVGFRFGTGKWDELPTTSLEYTNSGFVRTSSGAGTGMMNGIPSTTKGLMSYGQSGKTVRASSWRWWPVLQYIDPAESLLDLTNFKADEPPPKSVDLYVPKTQSVGGLVTVRNLRGDLIGTSINGGAVSVPIIPVTKVTIGFTPAATRAIKVLSEPPRSPVNITIGLLGTAPRGAAKQTPMVGPYGVKVVYDPTPLTGLK